MDSVDWGPLIGLLVTVMGSGAGLLWWSRHATGWATRTEQQTVDWITANVTDLASAKVVLVAMARMIVALRNKTWPGLTQQ